MRLLMSTYLTQVKRFSTAVEKMLLTKRFLEKDYARFPSDDSDATG